MERLKVLVYDSGVGGLAVLNKLVKRYKFFDFYYLSDKQNCPYGIKTVAELNKISSNLLEENNVKNFDIVVLACNTLSTNCKDFLLSKFNVPFFGVYPPLDVQGKTLLLCTKATAESTFVKNYANALTVFPCVGLVEDIENNILSLDKILNKKYQNFFPSGNFDNVILGCTHFIYLKPFLERMYTDAHFYDGTNFLYENLDHFCIENLGKATIFNHHDFLPKNRFVGRDGEHNFELYSRLFLN